MNKLMKIALWPVGVFLLIVALGAMLRGSKSSPPSVAKSTEQPKQEAPAGETGLLAPHGPIHNSLTVGMATISLGDNADDVRSLLDQAPYYFGDTKTIADPEMPGSTVVYHWYKIDGQWYRLEFARSPDKKLDSPYLLCGIAEGTR